jgi:predicted  nucleic acid-binding Zn ribbon protein
MKDAIISKITFGRTPENANEEWHEQTEEALEAWFRALQRHGQILGDPVRGVEEEAWFAFVRQPCGNSLAEENSSRYVLKQLECLNLLFGQRPEIRLLTQGCPEWTCSKWQESPWLVLLGAAEDGLGSLRASDLSCIPNYQIPLDADDSERLSFWAQAQERHKSIWFSSGSLEIEAYRALADPLSELNLQAASLAWQVEKAVGRPVFTTLFRHYALPDGKEENRPCPLCGEPWRVDDKDFPYRCEPCRLLSEIGPSDPENGLEWIGTWEKRTEAQPPFSRWPDDARSLASLLRKGHGSAYRQLLHEAPARVWALLEDCLRHDPRLDRQVESRDWFYGSLVLATHMPLTRVWKLLREAAEDDWLILEVVGWLTAQKIPGAAEAMVGEIARRERWQDVLSHIVTTGEDENAKLVCRIFQERFPESSQLVEAIQEAWRRNPALLKPLQDHETTVVRDALNKLKEQALENKRLRESQKAAASSATLRELIESCSTIEEGYFAGRCAADKAAAEDSTWLVSQLSHSSPGRGVAALIALQKVMHDELFEPVLDFFSEGLEREMKRGIRTRCTYTLLAASPLKSLPIGRLWIRDSHPERRTLARRILALHAEPNDTPLLRQLLAEGLRDEETHLYLICDCLKAFARFYDSDIPDEVIQAYHQMRYSYGRKLAAEAIHAMSPKTFREEYAQDCLLDCEADTRELAKSSLEPTSVSDA